ncbi:MAG: hypothetical protein IJW92_07705 [Clostridia bacterium]|nr:hypothetical protein [Clostridia bacterium]
MIKFSDYFTAPGIRSFAIRSGLTVGLIIGWFSSWQYGVIGGAATAILVSLIFPVIVYRAQLPYIRIKRTLPQPLLMDEPVRFTVKKGMVDGFFVLTEQSMVFLALSCASPRLELTRDDVKSIASGNDQPCINIFLNNTQFIRVFSGACDEILEILRENGWNVSL